MQQSIVLALLVLLSGCVASPDPAQLRAEADARMAFGGPSDVELADALWQAMLGLNLVGPNALQSHAYAGQHPHGSTLQQFSLTLRVGNENGPLLVKKNYSGNTLEEITVMYKRRPGYDPEDQNWYWVRYLPDGSIAQNSAGIRLAGRLLKPFADEDKSGDATGCIACHRAAPGGDLVFSHDRYRFR